MLNTKELVKKLIIFRTLTYMRNNKQFCASLKICMTYTENITVSFDISLI